MTWSAEMILVIATVVLMERPARAARTYVMHKWSCARHQSHHSGFLLVLDPARLQHALADGVPGCAGVGIHATSSPLRRRS